MLETKLMDEAAHLYQDHASSLVLFARQVTGSLADAEDAVHEGFLRVFGGRRRPPPGQAVAWLYKAVRWAAIDLVRKRSRRRDQDQAFGEAQPDHAWFEPAPDGGHDHEWIGGLLSKLHPDQREVVVMKIWGGLRFRDIAEVLSISPNTAASRYRYGLEALRRMMPDPDHLEARDD